MKPFDPWTTTLEEAMVADGGEPAGHPDDGVYSWKLDPKTGKRPHGPFSQWVAAHWILSEKGGIERGDGYHLMAAVNAVLTQALAAPPWLVGAFSEGFGKADRLEVDSWDEAFGKPIPKGRNKEKVKADRALFYKAFQALHAARQCGKPVCRALYEEIAKNLGSNRRKIEEILRRDEGIITHGFRKAHGQKKD